MDYKLDEQARCAVIGYGTWATALVDVLTQNEQQVGWYIRNEEVLESIRTEGRNLRYLSDLEFDRERIAPSDDLIPGLEVPSVYQSRSSQNAKQ